MSDHHPSTVAMAKHAGLVVKHAPGSVAQTVERLVAIVEGKGMKVFAVIDHSGEAERAGLHLRETKVVVFGAPQAGTPAMQEAPMAALDLPLKVLVWRDGEGTRLAYTAPSELARRYGLSADSAARLSGIDALTDAVAAG